MFSFIKKLVAIFNGDKDMPSDLMIRAMESSRMDSFSHSSIFSNGAENEVHGDYDDLEEIMLQQQMRDLDKQTMEQQMRDMHDPYLNPGQDIVVDEHYHGMDHGFDHGFDGGVHHHDF